MPSFLPLIARQIKAILFDLDDSLYLESEFFRSGFGCVAAYLGDKGIFSTTPANIVFESIHFNEGRENVFNKAAQRVPFPEEWITDLIEVFRNHTPQIHLSPEDIDALIALRTRYKLGCVTDGFAAVQRRKIEALGVAQFLDVIIIADDFGRSHWKPNPAPFLLCCERLGVLPENAIFVGDNLDRDIRGARQAGITAVRIRRDGSYFCNAEADDENKPDFEIKSLREIEILISQLNRKVSGDYRKNEP